MGDPFGKAKFQVIDSGAAIPLACMQEVIIWDETLALTPSTSVVAPFSDSFSTNDASNYTSTNNPSGGPAAWTITPGTGGSSTALTVYGSNVTTSIATGGKMSSTTGGTETSNNTNIGTNTGWGEVYAKGNASAWAAAGSAPAPSGNGWLFDVTTLEANQMLAGNWTPSLTIQLSSATGVSPTVTADMHIRAYRRSSGGTYTLIGDMVFAAQAITPAKTTYTFSATSLSASAVFATGDKLYIDFLLNVATNTNTAVGANLKSFVSNSGTQGVANDIQIITPGYGLAAVTGNLAGVGGTKALYLVNGWTAQASTLSETVTSSDFGGMAFNVVDASNYYEVSVQDASSSTPNKLNLFKTVAGTRSSHGNATIAFTRGTSHTVDVTVVANSNSNVITVNFDGSTKITYTDTSPLGSGQVGFRNDSGTSIYTAFSAISNDVATLTTSVPAHNYLQNNNFSSGSGAWVESGALTGRITFPHVSGNPATWNATLTFSNQAVGSDVRSQTVGNKQGPGTDYVVPGQQYCFSGTVNVTTPFTNSFAFLRIVFQDSTGATLSTFNSTNITAAGSYRYYVTAIAPANAFYVQAAIGGTTTNTTNSGVCTFTAMQLEPVWFPTLYSYPTPICDVLQSDSVTLPDATTSRFTRIMTGFITHLLATYEGTTRIWEVEVTAADFLLENVALINATYSNVTDLSIIQGVTASPLFAADPSLAANSPLALAFRNVAVCVAGVVINDLQFSDATLREVMNTLSDTTGFLYGVDPYYNVYYYPPFYNQCPYAFVGTTTAPDYVATFPYYDYSIAYDGTQLKNALRVVGNTFSSQITETFAANDGTHNQFIVSGSRCAGFYLTHTASGQQAIPTVVFGGVTQTTILDTGAGFGTAQTMIQYSNTHIGIASSIASGTSISVTYTYDTLAYVAVQSPDSIATIGQTMYGKINDNNLASLASAATRGEAELETYAQPQVTIKFKTRKMVQVGQTIVFTSALDGITNGHYAVQKVTARFLGPDLISNLPNEYDVEAGTYVDSFIDFFRNTQKATTRVSHDPAAAIQQTNNLQQDSVSLADSLNIHV